MSRRSGSVDGTGDEGTEGAAGALLARVAGDAMAGMCFVGIGATRHARTHAHVAPSSMVTVYLA